MQTLGGEVPPELQVTAEQDERLREQAARVGPTDVVRILDLIAVGLRAMKDGADARTQLELALVKAAVPKVDASAKALQSRLERLEAGRRRRPARGPRPDVPATAAGRAAAAAPSAPPPAAAPTPARQRRAAGRSGRRRPRRRPPLRPPPAPPAGRRADAAPPPLRPARPSPRPSPPVAAVAVIEPDAPGASRSSPPSASTSTASPSCGRP